MLCKNPRCMAQLGESQWGDGYCCKRCFETGPDYDPEAHDNLPHPDDRTQFKLDLVRNADLHDAMMEAQCIDPRLPKIIYLRRKGKTLRKIAELIGTSRDTPDRLLGNLTPNILRACGLR